jgi:glycosyltransferase involved in cell wall biosynthesis
MNALDCLVHPQIGTEGFAVVVLEAHACGKPVIASALDGIPEAFAVGAYGRLVPPEDVNTLAEAMRAITAQRASETTRAELHRKVSASFSLEVTARKVAEFYQRLHAGSK